MKQIETVLCALERALEAREELRTSEAMEFPIKARIAIWQEKKVTAEGELEQALFDLIEEGRG